MINQLVQNNIKNNLVYHASPFKLDILSGQKTSKWSNEVGNVFVTPCKGIAACFLINKNQILDKLSKQFPGKIIGLNFGYDIWNKPIQQLYKIPNNINILLNLPNIIPFSGSSTGYIYTIDFSKYKNTCHIFNKNPNSDVEFLIEGNVNFIKYKQVTINWTCMSSQQQIKRKGIAKVIQCYDPPYTYQQMLNAGYSQKLAQKLKADPVHGWRMQAGIELVHQQPSLAEQKRTWKNWQLMTPEQKDISQKKSIELFGKTNQDHYKEIMQNYWKEPIFQSKFQKLFQLIIEETDFNELDKIINFASTQTGIEIINKFKKCLNNSLNLFKQKFPEFKNVKLNFDIYQDQLVDIYAEIFPENLNIININLFPFLEKLYYATILHKDINKILNNMLIEIQTGTYENMQYPLLVHELAHIADFRKNKNIKNPHSISWEKQVNKIKNV